MQSLKRWVVLAAGLPLVVIDLGCAQLQEVRTRAATSPVLAGLHKPKDAPQAAKEEDLYARSLKRRQSGPRLAQREPTPEAGEPVASDGSRGLNLPSSGTPSSPRAGDGSGATKVALQPPVALPGLKPADPAQAANPSSPTWQASGPAESGRPILTGSKPRSASTVSRPEVTLEGVVADARAQLESLTSYQVVLSGQERVGGTLQPSEDVLLSVRRDPKAVRLEWQAGPHKGREVIYSSSEHGGLMHVNMADSIVPARLSIPPDSPLALRSSRHPITEAGFDSMLGYLETSVKRSKAGDPQIGKVTYAGLEQPPELDRPGHKIVRVTPAGDTWVLFLDPRTKLPALVQETSANGDLLERYVFRNLKSNVADLAQAEAFDPDRRWGEAKGLLSRMARASAANVKASATSVTR